MSSESGTRDYGRFDELAEEFAERFRRGERPTLQEYVDRLPEMGEEIREMFPALVEVERAEVDARGNVITPPPPVASHLSQIGDYRILREVGRGGMGVVYEAEQISLGRRVALKLLLGQALGHRKAQERFRREAKSAARLHHTNIVPVFEVGQEKDVCFYAMQLIQGQGLDQVIDELNRLREPGQKSHAKAPASPENPEAPETASLPGMAATSGQRKRELARMAESILTGRHLTERLEPAGNEADLATGPIATERFQLEAASAREPGLSRLGPPVSAPVSESSSAVMPGGKHVSELDTSGRRQPFFRSVAQIGRQATLGLAHAHTRGIVHRDIKPSNLLLDTDGVVWITDFGLAKADDDGMTASGDILGTLRYMAPERFRGGGDARADIFALGLTLYELLTLRPAYDSSNRLNLIEQIKNEEPASPRSIDRQIPRDLETIVLKAIAKEPQQRYPTADAMAEDLRRFLADEPIRARQISTSERYWRWARRNPVIAMLGGVLTAVLALVTIFSLLAMARFARLADIAGNAAATERVARIEADQARTNADKARGAAEAAGTAAQAEAYRAMLSEVKALRAGRQLGWREEALANLARLAVMPTSRRDLAELRTEAVASLGEFGVREVARLVVPDWSAYSTDFSPDSRTLVTATNDGTLDLWDVPSRQHLRRIVGLARRELNRNHARGGGLARFLHDGDLVFLSSNDGVAFLDASGQPSARPPIAREGATAIKLRSDVQGRWLAVGWNDGRLDLYDAVTGALKRSFDCEGEWDFAFSPDGAWLALQTQGGRLKLVSTSGQLSGFTLSQRGGYVPALAFSPDGGKLASVDDRAVLVWDLTSRQESLRLTGHKETVTGIAFSPDGSLIATSCGDATTRIWDARDGRPLTSLPGPTYLQALVFSPDGESLAVSAQEGQVCLYQVEGRREQRRLIGHKFGVHRLVPHPSLPRIASSSDDHAVMLWDPNSAKSLSRWIAHSAWTTGLAISPDGSLIASTRGNGDATDSFAIRLWDAETGTLKKMLPGNAHGIWTLAFDPTGRRLASGDSLGNLLLFEVDTGRVLRRERLGSCVWSIAFLDGGSSLLVGLLQGGVALFDLSKTEPPRRVVLPDGCTRLMVDKNTNRAIVGDSKGALIALSLPDLKIVHRLDKAHDDEITSLAMSPAGHLLATGGKDRLVVFRDPATFQPLLTFPAWTGPLKDLTFDVTGRWLAMAGADSEIGLWDLGLIHNELAAVGLSWDQTATSAGSISDISSAGDRPDRQVPVIRAVTIDPAELQKATNLVNSGEAAFEKGQIAAAAIDFQDASERLRAMRRSLPGDPELARLHGISLGFLGSCMRDLKRPREALARTRESLAVYGSMKIPHRGDLYNMACGSAMVSVLDDQASSSDREKLQARAVEYLRRAVEADPLRMLPQVADDRDLDPLRNRADFHDMIADAAFPRDPFLKAGPGSEPSTPAESATSLAQRKEQGFALLAAGRTLDGLAVLASVWESDRGDTSLLITVGALQAWLGKDAEFELTCRRSLESAQGTEEPTTAERTAKILSLRPSADKTRVDAAHELSHRGVTLGKDNPLLPYFQMARGMAEYRSGHHTACQEALLAALGEGNFNPLLTGTSEFYLAMSLFREGKDAEARQNATQAISRMKPLPADENNPFANGAGPDDLILWMASKEARALLKLEAAPAAQSQVKPDR